MLEHRELLTTFTVSNLLGSGAGSLRQAMLDANANKGADEIAFSVAGTIEVGTTALPALTDPVAIEGSTAPGFQGTPVVTIDFQGTPGLVVGAGADGSSIRSLALDNASTAGLTLIGSNVVVQGNYIGLEADGATVAGNRGDGVQINASSKGDLIGNANPVTSTSYYPAPDFTFANNSQAGSQPVTAWQGIRPTGTSGQYLITGTSTSSGLLFEGSIAGVGQSYSVNYPGAATTSVYGPDSLTGGQLRLVGSYKNPDSGTAPVTVNGFLFQGTTADLSNANDYRTIDYPGEEYTYVHSTMGNLAVGNADGPTATGLPLGTGHAFLYDVAAGKIITDIVYPGSVSNTAYGIWYNGGTSYTICGGYSNLPVNANNDQSQPIGQAYMVDYDAATGKFSHWTSFNYLNGAVGTNYITHFEGISSTEKGVYTLNADSVQSGTSNPLQGSWVTVRRNTDGSFGTAEWVNLNYPGTQGITSSNSVAGNAVVGLVVGPDGTQSFQATVNEGFQLSNVISGNAGNGIGVYGSSGDRIAMNDIGTDVTGEAALGNGGNGILLAAGAAGNIIGGQSTNGNDPTAGVFARPPQGNLISGNHQDGVLITGGATQNVLSGNFIGTKASGNAALGNRLDGVAIVHADGNQLIGCTFQQSPFVFYNVISGNGGNGLRISDSNNTVVQANFLGAAANNARVVPNGGDGLLVTGTSANTQVGGVIPLGNVISGNAQNGIEVRDQVTGFISFNTFAGMFAFGGAAPNQRDGILITSTGGNNLIRTCLVAGNLGNGLELSGYATGVQVTDTGFGLNSSLSAPIPNGGDGILIDGFAHHNVIGGFQKSVEPQVTTSANGRFGIEFAGAANHNLVFGTHVGTNALGQMALGNGLGGILLGPGTSSNILGGGSSLLHNLIRFNAGNGISILSSKGNVLLNNQVLNNSLSGIAVVSGSDNTIGAPGAGNVLAGNGNGGILAIGNLSGSRVLGNLVAGNSRFGMILANATGPVLAEANTIAGNAGNGVTIASVQALTLGGRPASSGNRIVSNQGYGLLAVGNCARSRVIGNVIAQNTRGNVNIRRARGLRYIP